MILKVILTISLICSIIGILLITGVFMAHMRINGAKYTAAEVVISLIFLFPLVTGVILELMGK